MASRGFFFRALFTLFAHAESSDGKKWRENGVEGVLHYQKFYSAIDLLLACLLGSDLLFTLQVLFFASESFGRV